MTDASQPQDNRSPGEKKAPPAPYAMNAPSADPFAADMKSDVITEKFLTVAKEKSNLESVIMSQNDMIKELEKEKEKLTLSLRQFSASHKSMKEKLLDFDILRNMEISELKKKIEHLIAENKRLISEKDSIFRNLERDTKNISRVDHQAVESLMREKRELEEQLRKLLAHAGREDEERIRPSAFREAGSQRTNVTSVLKTVEDFESSNAADEFDPAGMRESLKTAATAVQELERELSLARSHIAELELDRDEARAELYNGRVELDNLKADKAHVEENLQQKLHDYSNEIVELKTDIDELTSAIEGKIHFIDELNAKVVRLSDALSHKDSELHEQIPALVEKINSLAKSIDAKMEENSLFAKELFDLNVKIATLNEEMIEKDELLIDISEDYKKQKNEIEALHGAHELTLKNLVHERDQLKKENEDLRTIPVMPLEQVKKEQQEKMLLEVRLSEQLNVLDGLNRRNDGLAAQIAEKDVVISDLQKDILRLRLEAEATAADHAEDLAAVRGKLSALTQQLLEKDEVVDTLTSERSQAYEKDQVIAGLQQELLQHQKSLDEAAAEYASDLHLLREKVAILNQQLLEKNEMLTVTASEREHDKNEFLSQIDMLRRERTELDEEMNRLLASGREQEEARKSQASLLDAAWREKAGLEEDLLKATEKSNELVLELDRLRSLNAQKEQTLSEAWAEISRLQEVVSVKQASQAELEKKMRETHEISGLTDAEKEEFERAALDYRETFEHLKQEIISLNRNLAEKEQIIDLLVSEKDSLARNLAERQENLTQALSSQSGLQLQLDENLRDSRRLSAENSDLTNAIARLQNDIAGLQRTKEDELKALKDELSSYGAAVADLRLSLEERLQENAELRSRLKTSQSAAQEATAPVIEKRAETLPARLEKRSETGKHVSAYAFLALFLLGCIGFFFYAYNTGLIAVLMEKPAVTKEIRKELAYNDMFSLLTKTSASDDLKFQATLLTESLVLKSDTPQERSFFDFNNHLYFKISISAPKAGLDDSITADPSSMITLTASAAAVKPLPHVRVKEIKTFYRKEEPVSVMFYCAFPRAALTPESTALSLSFRNEKEKADLSWDLKTLRAGSLLP